MNIRERVVLVTKDEILEGMYEVETLSREQFLKVRETLTRIGICSVNSEPPTLWQTCHILHKRGRYYICHFKQLFLLDGRASSTNYSDDDCQRLNYIVKLLDEWQLVTSKFEPEAGSSLGVVVIPFSKKCNWLLKSKYTMGVHNGKKTKASGTGCPD